MPLRTLLKDIRACRICVDTPRGKPLPHDPRPVLRAKRSARICIAGQAPGTRVHASGKPFTDPSGDRLRAWMGIDAETFYDEAQIAIIPMGFCFPGHDMNGGDRPPRRECALAWRAKLFAELPHLELMLLVGQYAQTWHLGTAAQPTLTATVRNWRAVMALEGPPVRIPLPHPSWRNSGWLKKNPWFEEDLLPVLQGRVAHLVSSSF